MQRLKNKAFNITILTVIITVLMQFGFIRFVSYGMEKVDYGNFVLLQTLIAGLSAVLLQIPGQSFDRFYNSASHKINFINEFRTLLIAINIISLLLILVYSYFFQKFSSHIYLLGFLLFIAINNYTLNQKVFLFNLERGKYFYLKVMEASARFLFPILAYIYFQNLESLIFGTILGYAFSYILLIFYLKDYPFTFRINFENYKKYFLFAYSVVFVSVFTWGISFSDRYFIDYFLTTEDVAIYSLLAVVAGIGQIVGQIYFMYVEPKILKSYDVDTERTFINLNKYLFKLFIVFIILTLIALFIPKCTYTLLLEKEIIYNQYYFNTMIVLLLSIFLNILHTAHHMYFKLLKRLDILAYIYFIALFCNLLINFWIKEYGILVAAFSTLFAYTTILILQYIVIQKLLKSVRSKSKKVML